LKAVTDPAWQNKFPVDMPTNISPRTAPKKCSRMVTHAENHPEHIFIYTVTRYQGGHLHSKPR